MKLTVGQDNNSSKLELLMSKWEVKNTLKLLETKTYRNDLKTHVWVYAKIGDYKHVIKYASLAILAEDCDPIVYYYYAKALKQDGQCEKAKEYYKYYNRLNPSSWGEYSFGCDSINLEKLRKRGQQVVINPIQELNTALDELLPMVYKDKFLFARGKEQSYPQERILDKLTTPDIKFYIVDYGTYKIGNVDYVKLLNGASCIVETLLMTTTKVKFKGKKHQQIHSINNIKTSNSQKKGLPFNSYDYTTCYPSLSQNGEMLIFASDMPGGFGGYDLYVSYKNHYYHDDSIKRWSPPCNLGPLVNTEADEISPYLTDENILYFSSNCPASIGGFDLFYTIFEHGSTTEVYNLGIGINSKDNELSLIYEPNSIKKGYFVSDREGGKGGYDLYQFTIQTD